MKAHRFSLSGYDNDYAEQGMHECKCGVIAENLSFRTLLEEVRKAIRFYRMEYDTSRGRWSLTLSGRSLFIDWWEKGNDRCFGLEVEF